MSVAAVDELSADPCDVHSVVVLRRRQPGVVRGQVVLKLRERATALERLQDPERLLHRRQAEVYGRKESTMRNAKR
jgi:hypothetical protein